MKWSSGLGDDRSYVERSWHSRKVDTNNRDSAMRYYLANTKETSGGCREPITGNIKITSTSRFYFGYRTLRGLAWFFNNEVSFTKGHLFQVGCGNNKCCALAHVTKETTTYAQSRQRISNLSVEELLAVNTVQREGTGCRVPLNKNGQLTPRCSKKYGVSTYSRLAYITANPDVDTSKGYVKATCGTKHCCNPTHLTISTGSWTNREKLQQVNAVTIRNYIRIKSKVFWRADRLGLINWALHSRFPVYLRGGVPHRVYVV